MGLTLSTHKRAKKLSEALWGLKEIFLVGFFLQIGMTGLPQMNDLIFALAVVLILPLKGLLFFGLLLLFKLRARSSFMAAISLTAYSEFGLIVASGVLPEWLVPLALAVALSLVVSAPLNRISQQLFDRFEPLLAKFELAKIHRDEMPTDLGDASILIIGMGRTGTAAYDQLKKHYDHIIAVDADTYKVASHREAGRNAVFADVEDTGFWRGLNISPLKTVIVAIDSIEAKEAAVRALRQIGFIGPIVSHALFEQDIDRLVNSGATHTYLTMNQAGIELARLASEALDYESSAAG
jgi:hypothetical protein